MAWLSLVIPLLAGFLFLPLACTVSSNEVTPETTPYSTPEVTPTPAQYSGAQINYWYRLFLDSYSSVRGVTWTKADGLKNRILVGMYPTRGGLEEIEALLAGLGIPRDVVIVEIGCAGRSQEPPGADQSLLGGLHSWIDVGSSFEYGEVVPMELRLKNLSDRPLQFYLGDHDFIVTTLDGVEVWHWQCGKISLLPLDPVSLGPGEELELVGEWEQVDNRGNSVPPGKYLVRGVFLIETSDQRYGYMETQPKELVIEG